MLVASIQTENFINLYAWGAAMYGKFPFYSIAQMYAIGLNVPVSILLGRDNLYWVVDQSLVSDLKNDGCSQLNATTT